MGLFPPPLGREPPGEVTSAPAACPVRTRSIHRGRTVFVSPNLELEVAANTEADSSTHLPNDEHLLGARSTMGETDPAVTQT